MSNIHDLAGLIEGSAELTWLRDAACADLELSELALFFVDAGRSLSQDAHRLCAGCAVRAECLEHAYAHEIAGGYFGGVSPTKRRSRPLSELLAGESSTRGRGRSGS